MRDADARRVVGAGEILELGRVVERLRPVVEQRPHDRAGKDRADHRPVLGRDAVDEGGGAAAAGAGLVLHDDGRIPRNEAREMAAEHAGVDVVAAADIAADEKVDGLAGVVVRGRCGRAIALGPPGTLRARSSGLLRSYSTREGGWRGQCVATVRRPDIPNTTVAIATNAHAAM